MKTLSEIKRNLISFYTSIQDRITDFSVGSVINGIFYSISYTMEDAYREIEGVRQQAYISTATGRYLDKLIYGTYQLNRSPATRNVGYVVIYGDSPISSPEDVELKYAEFDYSTGEFTRGLQDSTKFLGFNVQGEEGIVYSLINPRNTRSDAGIDYVDATSRLINLGGRNIQFLILPVASVLKGSQVQVREGGIYSFPSPPPGISGVINTSNPGSVFFSSSETVSGAPFFSRYTEILSYTNSTNSLRVINAYNFSNRGFLEIARDENENAVEATYSDGTTSRVAGLVFEYIDATTSSITLKQPIDNSSGTLPSLTVVVDGTVTTLPLTQFTYNGTTYSGANLDSDIVTLINDGSHPSFIVQQRPDQISGDLIFDPDEVLTTDYKLIETAKISGATDADTDEEYREALRAYLASLSKATNVALEAGTLQIPGITFANTLPASQAPRGSAIVLAANDEGTLSLGQRGDIRKYLRDDWAAAGINVIVKAPELIQVNTTVSIKLQAGVFRSSVTQQIQATIEEYLRLTNPGDSLRYSDILEAIADIGGVTNVFNLILTKQLTDQTYRTYKGEYNESVLVKAAGGTKPINVNQVGHGFVTANLGSPIDVDTHTLGLTNADGILYAIVDNDNYEYLPSSKDLTTLSAMYVAIQDAQTDSFDEFKNIIVDYQEGTEATNFISDTSEDYKYFLSYILGEPLDDSSGTSLYPINPNLIRYEDIRDYEASPVEIFRANSVTLGTETELLVGIKYT